MSNSFNVVLTGELLKGQSIMQAANSLSRLFKIAPLQAQQMLARAPLVIKKNLEEDTAVRFVQAMYKSGFGASVEQHKASRTSLLMHPLAPLYEDDDEGLAVTRITPVLVEQSRLEESLENELSIPSAEPVNTTAAITKPLVQSIQTPRDTSTRVELQQPQNEAQVVSLKVADELPVTVVVETVAEPVMEVDATPIAQQQSVSAVTSDVELAAAVQVESELSPAPLAVVVAPAAIAEAEIAEASLKTINSELINEVNAKADPVETHPSISANPFDPFAVWGGDAIESSIAASINIVELSAVEITPIIEDDGDAVNSARIQDATHLDEALELAATQSIDTEHAEDDDSAEPVLQPVAVEEVVADVVEECAETEISEMAYVDETVHAEDIAEDLATEESVVEELEASAEIPAVAQMIESSEAAPDLDARQWMEPVAQWQTVAELAEGLTQDHSSVAAEPVYLANEAAVTQPHYADAGSGGLPPNAKNGVDANRFDTQPAEEDDRAEQAHARNDYDQDLIPASSESEDWDAPVQVSEALTQKLAQIAQESKTVILDGDAQTQQQLVQEQNAVLDPEVSGDFPDGVLLFEEADVSQISAINWDDWHPTDAVDNNQSTPIPNPLLDFDQVEPDWKNRAVELSFNDTAQGATVGAALGSFDLAEENQHELEAFLESSDCDERVDYSDKKPIPVEANATIVAVPLATARADAALDLLQTAPESSPSAGRAATQLDGGGWAHEISVQASCGFLEVSIPKGKELNVAAAAAVTMGLSLHEQLQAGNGVKAWLLAKGFLINTYEALESAGNLGITAITHGMVCAIDVHEFPVMVQQSAYLASTDEVKLNADQSRLNPVVNACKWMHCSGAGELWLNAQGLWEMIEVDGSFTINSRYIMAFSQSLRLQAPPLAGLKSFLTSGSGVECRLKGRGLVWVQTEAAKAPVLWQKAG